VIERTLDFVLYIVSFSTIIVAISAFYIFRLVIFSNDYQKFLTLCYIIYDKYKTLFNIIINIYIIYT